MICINFRSHQITINVEDLDCGSRPGNSSSLVVSKEGQGHTCKFVGMNNTYSSGNFELEGQALFYLMQAIVNV